MLSIHFNIRAYSPIYNFPIYQSRTITVKIGSGIHGQMVRDTCPSLLRVRINGICGQVVRVVDIESLAPQGYGFKSCQGLSILSCDEGMKLALPPA